MEKIIQIIILYLYNQASNMYESKSTVYNKSRY